jgi:hypothetical protein
MKLAKMQIVVVTRRTGVGPKFSPLGHKVAALVRENDQQAARIRELEATLKEATDITREWRPLAECGELEPVEYVVEWVDHGVTRSYAAVAHVTPAGFARRCGRYGQVVTVLFVNGKALRLDGIK